MLCKTRQYQARITRDRQQHLAHGLRLLRPQTLRCRPVARQAKLAKILQRGGGAGGLRRHQAGELLDAQSRKVQGGSYQDGVRKLLFIGQGADDVCRFNSQDGRRGRATSCALDRCRGLRDRIAHPLWADQYRFHDMPCVA